MLSIYLIDYSFYFQFQVVFLHPVHNYALVAYDPSALGLAGASVVRAAELLPGIFDLLVNSVSFLFINMFLGTLPALNVLAIKTYFAQICFFSSKC